MHSISAKLDLFVPTHTCCFARLGNNHFWPYNKYCSSKSYKETAIPCAVILTVLAAGITAVVKYVQPLPFKNEFSPVKSVPNESLWA